ncbi:hypothetical protein EDC01DRAFT_788412 [Geopyxis carbonaria]|nr:hypothetical protein EDC01DRAFT_788412 [Geopyxis carbonaria]
MVYFNPQRIPLLKITDHFHEGPKPKPGQDPSLQYDYANFYKATLRYEPDEDEDLDEGVEEDPISVVMLPPKPLKHDDQDRDLNVIGPSKVLAKAEDNIIEATPKSLQTPKLKEECSPDSLQPLKDRVVQTEETEKSTPTVAAAPQDRWPQLATPMALETPKVKEECSPDSLPTVKDKVVRTEENERWPQFATPKAFGSPKVKDEYSPYSLPTLKDRVEPFDHLTVAETKQQTEEVLSQLVVAPGIEVQSSVDESSTLVESEKQPAESGEQSPETMQSVRIEEKCSPENPLVCTDNAEQIQQPDSPTTLAPETPNIVHDSSLGGVLAVGENVTAAEEAIPSESGTSPIVEIKEEHSPQTPKPNTGSEKTGIKKSAPAVEAVLPKTESIFTVKVEEKWSPTSPLNWADEVEEYAASHPSDPTPTKAYPKSPETPGSSNATTKHRPPPINTQSGKKLWPLWGKDNQSQKSSTDSPGKDVFADPWLPPHLRKVAVDNRTPVKLNAKGRPTLAMSKGYASCGSTNVILETAKPEEHATGQSAQDVEYELDPEDVDDALPGIKVANERFDPAEEARRTSDAEIRSRGFGTAAVVVSPIFTGNRFERRVQPSTSSPVTPRRPKIVPLKKDDKSASGPLSSDKPLYADKLKVGLPATGSIAIKVEPTPTPEAKRSAVWDYARKKHDWEQEPELHAQGEASCPGCVPVAWLKASTQSETLLRYRRQLKAAESREKELMAGLATQHKKVEDLERQLFQAKAVKSTNTTSKNPAKTNPEDGLIWKDFQAERKEQDADRAKKFEALENRLKTIEAKHKQDLENIAKGYEEKLDHVKADLEDMNTVMESRNLTIEAMAMELKVLRSQIGRKK